MATGGAGMTNPHTCECGRTIRGRADQCKSCTMKAAWRDGRYAGKVARDYWRHTRPGPYIIDYETLTEAGWPMLRPAPV